MKLSIVPAEKIKQYARVCLWGVEKSGKTHTALTLATALAGEGGKVGVISSEFGSSKLLSSKFPHDIIDLVALDENGNLPRKPFTPERYEEALHLFIDAGYKAIVIDSLSHMWQGEGGILEAVGKAGKNSFSDGWGENTPVYNRFITTILGAKCHIIITLRAKDKYEQEEYIKSNGSKGSAPKNVGEAPVIRKGFGYEMQLTLRMDGMTAYVQSSAVEEYIHKNEEIEKPGPELAYRLLEALDGVPLPEPTSQQKEMRKLLQEFYSFSPATYARIPNWEELALRKSLDLSQEDVLPTEYTDDDVSRMDLYVAQKRQEKTNKAS